MLSNFSISLVLLLLGSPFTTLKASNLTSYSACLKEKEKTFNYFFELLSKLSIILIAKPHACLSFYWKPPLICQNKLAAIAPTDGNSTLTPIFAISSTLTFALALLFAFANLVAKYTD